MSSEEKSWCGCGDSATRFRKTNVLGVTSTIEGMCSFCAETSDHTRFSDWLSKEEMTVLEVMAS